MGVNTAGDEELIAGGVNIVNPITIVTKISAPDDVPLSVDLGCKILSVLPPTVWTWDLPVAAYKDAIT